MPTIEASLTAPWGHPGYFRKIQALLAIIQEGQEVLQLGPAQVLPIDQLNVVPVEMKEENGIEAAKSVKIFAVVKTSPYFLLSSVSSRIHQQVPWNSLERSWTSWLPPYTIPSMVNMHLPYPMGTDSNSSIQESLEKPDVSKTAMIPQMVSVKDVSSESTVSEKEKMDVELGIHFTFHFKMSIGLTNSDKDRMELGKAHIQGIFDADEPMEVSDSERMLYKIKQLE